MVSDPLTDGCYRPCDDYDVNAMLIVCPSCATSYMIDPTTLGAAGRTVRCARCKVTWFAEGPSAPPALNEFVDGVIAEAETQSVSEPAAEGSPPPAEAAPSHDPTPAEEDDFGAESLVPISEAGTRESENDDEARTSLPPADSPETESVSPPPSPIADAPSLVPPAEHEPLPEAADAAADSDDIDNFTARRQRLQARRKEKRRSTRWIALVLVLFAVNVALVGARNEVVRALPQTASFFAAIGLPVNLRQLSFENVKISKDAQDGVNVLVVQGTIVSKADKPITVPRLRFAARDAAGQEIYTWTALPTRSILGPGEKLEFRSRLASPPADARNVLVRFLNPRDAQTGAE
jgi:predicted Zn finger-like uncharacterized protein